ncbi:MAG TPA: hypothetical protein ENN33_06330 [Ignavibacteria bacterium]|nr:hypothetical protein [Ignavibacteria bacterium]
MNTPAENAKASTFRKYGSVFKETEDTLILKDFNLALFYDKETMEFTREASMGFKGTERGVVVPNLIWINEQGDVLFSYRYTEGYLLRSGKNKAKRIEHKDIVKVLNACGYEFIIVKSDDDFKVFRSKSSIVEGSGPALNSK